MARARKTRSAEQLRAFKQASGWYLAAWRDYREMTLDELSEKTGRSKGFLSDLETGASRKDRPPQRYNRDLLDEMAKVMETTQGRLIDVNPFVFDERSANLGDEIAKLDEQGREAVKTMVENLLRLAS